MRCRRDRDEIARHSFWGALAVLYMAASTQACAPRSVYRPTLPPPVSSSQPSPASPSAAPPPVEARSATEPAVIGEEDLFKGRRQAPLPTPQEPQLTAQTSLPPPASAPLPEERSLLPKITPKTPPQRAASLRVADEGRRLLEAGNHAKALSRLEKAIAIDATNPYGYYFLAKAHYSLGRYQESLKFLAVAESSLASEPYWLSEVYALRGENYRALGFLERADLNYAQALRLNPGNRIAADGQSRIQQEEGRPGSR